MNLLSVVLGFLLCIATMAAVASLFFLNRLNRQTRRLRHEEWRWLPAPNWRSSRGRMGKAAEGNYW